MQRTTFVIPATCVVAQAIKVARCLLAARAEAWHMPAELNLDLTFGAQLNTACLPSQAHISLTESRLLVHLLLSYKGSGEVCMREKF